LETSRVTETMCPTTDILELPSCSESKQLFTLAFGVALAVVLGVLPGCAAYQKCGFGGCPGDEEINADVRLRIDQQPALGPPNLLNVQTLDHVVYLTGLVDTDLERQMAESAARQAPGVTKVINSIGLAGGR
jgi:hypothetical protein